MSASTNMYRYHVKNLKGLEKTIDDIEAVVRDSIRYNDSRKNLKSFNRIYAFLIAAWAETRLNKILYETHTFSETSVQAIKAQNNQLDTWKKAVELAFRQHHSVPRAPLTDRNIGVTHAAKFHALLSILENELKIIIQVRNKLAHGQWLYPLNYEMTEVSEKMCRELNTENFLSLKFKFQIIKHLSDIIHDLVVSQSTFDRDFESKFRKLQNAKTNLETRKYADYKTKLINRRIYGEQQRVQPN